MIPTPPPPIGLVILAGTLTVIITTMYLRQARSHAEQVPAEEFLPSSEPPPDSGPDRPAPIVPTDEEIGIDDVMLYIDDNRLN